MIFANGLKIEPTIFPDGTSQVWKLPPSLNSPTSLHIDWRFENEAELFHLMSLITLCTNRDRNIRLTLHVPYLPYARQDKEITNNKTFNLHVFAEFINAIGFERVTAVDVHNKKLTGELIRNFKNLSVSHIHLNLLSLFPEATVVYPDRGARERYILPDFVRDEILFYKIRDQESGKILGHELDVELSSLAPKVKEFLILDDICDGGATFLSVARELRKLNPTAKIILFITHGIFSRGLSPFIKEEITVYTTNSLMKNASYERMFFV